MAQEIIHVLSAMARLPGVTIVTVYHALNVMNKEKIPLIHVLKRLIQHAYQMKSLFIKILIIVGPASGGRVPGTGTAGAAILGLT